MAVERFKNLFVNAESSINYASSGRGEKKFPPRDSQHGNRILNKLENIWRDYDDNGVERNAVSFANKKGVYVEFHSSPDFELEVNSLDSTRTGIRLLNIRTEVEDEKQLRKAMVFIPEAKKQYFIKKIQDYCEPREGKPKNYALVESINDIRLAVLESFWLPEHKVWIPEGEPAWCEIWLNSDSDESELEFREIVSNNLHIPLQENSLRFPERRVVLVKANREQLNALVLHSPHIAEMRRADEIASFFVELDNTEQTEWAKDLMTRLHVNEDTNVYVSILDTGVNNGHMLLKPVLRDEDCRSFHPEWGSYDHEGHGTKMSGIIAYGDLKEALEGNHEVHISHLLESLKILPPAGENEAKLYGYITQQLISNAIIDAPERKRVLCMAITAPKYQTNDGRPSSWSAAIDEITSGYVDEDRKLFILSAGNIMDNNEWSIYPDSNMTHSIQNPGQSWNALTVGAYTNLSEIRTQGNKNAEVVAPRGGLSPYSSTSITWGKGWPVKPEIVLEGGNVLRDRFGCVWDGEQSLITTSSDQREGQFTYFNATSAAAAQAAWMASQINIEYPDIWPETIRGLLVHSAQWTEAMKEQFLHGSNKGDYKRLLRTCGYGVPNLDRALWCAKNTVNLIAEAEIEPYERRSSVSLKDMHIHELPWPKDILLSLGETPVQLRVTLSYFIEPSPGEVGWKDRYKYSSFGLRFATNGTNSKEEFLRKVNIAARDEDGELSVNTDGGVNWTLGDNNRNLGSIHSDIWEAPASLIATSNLIGVYPTHGWWSKRKWLNRWGRKVRYSLIISLHTPEQSIDLYTPIINKIKVSNPVTVENK